MNLTVAAAEPIARLVMASETPMNVYFRAAGSDGLNGVGNVDFGVAGVEALRKHLEKLSTAQHAPVLMKNLYLPFPLVEQNGMQYNYLRYKEVLDDLRQVVKDSYKGS